MVKQLKNLEMMLEKENYLAFEHMNDQEWLYDNEVVIDFLIQYMEVLDQSTIRI
jgi:hypothetical protein